MKTEKSALKTEPFKYDMLNGLIAFDKIEVEPRVVTKSGLIMAPSKKQEEYEWDTHPFQGTVLHDYTFMNTGQQLKKGDRILLKTFSDIFFNDKGDKVSYTHSSNVICKVI